MGSDEKAEAAYENPLIPNARLRQIYLAMVKARMLEKALRAARRGRVVSGGHAVGIAGLEPCLVSAAIDLGTGDLVSDALSGGVIEFLRGTALGAVLKPEKKVPGKRQVKADCGAGRPLPTVGGAAERLWGALGAAAALKTLAGKDSSIIVAFVRAGEVSPALWSKLLTSAAETLLPIIFVVMPPARGAVATGGVSALARRCGVPGIAVDGDDAVAIYRVAQESIGRARVGGGAALMECVPFLLPAGKGKRGDAIAALAAYLSQRGVVTQRWMDAEARTFARWLGSASA